MSILEFGSAGVPLEALAREAATVADNATTSVMSRYRTMTAAGEREEEPAITARLAQAIGDAFAFRPVGGVQWSSTVVKTSRSKRMNEDKVGADLLIHITIKTPMKTISKGVLIQGKRKEHKERLKPNEFARLQKQCKDMLGISEESYIFNFDTDGLRSGNARAWQNFQTKNLGEVCKQSSFDFFHDLFKCDKGDRKITSWKVNDLPVPNKVGIIAEGDIKGLV